MPTENDSIYYLDGIYDKKELVTYLAGLKKILDAAPPLTIYLPHFILSNQTSIIRIAYNPRTQQWLLNNNEHSSQELAEKIFSIFSTNRWATFSTEIQRTDPHEPFFNYVIESTKNQEEIQKIHSISPSKAKLADDKNHSWLLTAARKGNVMNVNKLLWQGADINIATIGGITPFFAAIQFRRYDVIRALLLHEATLVNIPLTNGSTPLYMSVCQGFLELVDLLLAYNANPNLVSPYNDNETPLFVAANNGYSQIVSMLLTKGANPLLATFRERNTPLLIASHNGHTSVVKLLLTAEYIDLDCSHMNKNGVTPLYAAAQNGHFEIAQLLLRAGASADLVFENKAINATPLFIAAYNGHFEIVSILLQTGGVKVNHRPTNGATPLFAASQNGHTDIARILIKNSANIHLAYTTSLESLRYFAKELKVEASLENFLEEKNHTDSSISITPKEIAIIMGHTDIVDLLENALCELAPQTSLSTHTNQINFTLFLNPDLLTESTPEKRSSPSPR